MKIFLNTLLFLSLSITLTGQSDIAKGAGLWFSYGVPTTLPDTTIGTELCFDVLNSNLYYINRTTFAWTLYSGAADHGALTGLTDDDHPQYALLAGRSTGQTLNGGTDSGDSLVLNSTSNATKGLVKIGNTFYVEESTGRVGLGTDDPTNGRFHMTGTSSEESIRVSNTGTGRAKIHLEVEPGGNDSYVHWDVNGTRNYVFGIDNSDSDILKLRSSSDPSTGTTALSVNSTGELGLENLVEDNTLEDIVVVDGNNIAHSRDLSTIVSSSVYGELYFASISDSLKLTSSNNTTVIFDTQGENTGVTLTDSTFTVDSDGKYLIQYDLSIGILDGNTGLSCTNTNFRLLKNDAFVSGTNHGTSRFSTDGNHRHPVGGSRILDLSTSDVIKLASLSGCSSQNIKVLTGNFIIQKL